MLNLLLPSEGLYCVAVLKPEGKFQHRWWSAIEQARTSALALDAAGETVFIAQASFQTSESRKAVNACRVRSFWFDIDCAPIGVIDSTKPFADQREGAAALRLFLDETGLPMPYVVNSGNGLYAHFILTQDILPDQWKATANILKKVTDAYGFKVDDTRTADLSSVLRPIGTHNRKRGANKPVHLVRESAPIDYTHFASLVQRAADAKKIDTTQLSAPTAYTGLNDEFVSGIGEGPPCSGAEAANHCAQLARFRDKLGDIPEPEWYAGIGVLRHCVEGEALIQEWSMGHPDYSPDGTRTKIEQHQMPPTTCQHYGGINPTGCVGCRHNGKIKTPIVLGRMILQQNDLDVARIRMTDTGLAELAARQFDGKLLYWPEADKWLVYDDRRWCSDTPGSIFPHIKHLMAELYRRAILVEDTERRAAILKALVKQDGYYRQETLVKAMQVIPAIIVGSHQLDADPMLLNCLNGTLNLTTGQLLAHNPQHLITRIVNVVYDPSATCPKFKTFLHRIFAGNNDLIGYIWRLLGYCLTGRTDEQSLTFFYGTGANGKTTLVRLVLVLLFDFASSASADLLMLKNNDSQSNDLARLRGARLVSVNEVNEGARLDEAKVKTLTGGDPVTARFLFQEFFEYFPQFKLILVGNHKPTIKGRDHGIWRRIHLVPFTVTIPQDECDPCLLEKLKAELPGILAWAVQGCVEWQKVGLKPPQEVIAAVQEYRETEDVFGQWLRDYCVRQPGAWAKGDIMFNSFKQATGLTHLSSNKFTKLMKDEGFTEDRKNAGKFWIGVALKSFAPESSM